MKTKSSQVIDLLVISLFVGLLFYRYFADPSANVHGDWGVMSRESAFEYLDGPSLWDRVLLQTGGGYFLQLNRFPILYIHALGMLLTGYDFSLLTILVYPFSIVAALSCYLLCTYVDMKRVPRLMSSLAYSASPTVFLRFQAGHLPILMAYSIYPICLAFFIKGLREKSTLGSIQSGLICGISVAICAFYELRIGYLILLLIAIAGTALLAFDMCLIAVKKTAHLRRHVVLICAICIAFIGMSWFYLVPYMIDMPLMPVPLAATRWLAALSVSPLLLTMNWFNSYFLTKYDVVSIAAVAIFAGLAYLAAILRPRRKTSQLVHPISQLLLLGVLTAAFLSKGTQPPLEFVNEWIYRNIPLLSTIREPLRFMVIGEVFYCMLLGFSVDSINTILCSRRKPNLSIKRKGTQFLLMCMVLALILGRVTPALDGRIAVYGFSYDPSHIEALQKTIGSDGRVASIPFSPRYYLKDQIDWFQLLWQAPRATAMVAQTHTQSFKGEDLKAVLALLGVSHVIVPPRNDPSWSLFGERQRYLDLIESAECTKQINDPIEVYSTSVRTPVFYAPDRIVLVVGSPKVALNLLSSVDPGRVVFFFLDQIPEDIDEILEVCDVVVLESEAGIYDIGMRKLSLMNGIALEERSSFDRKERAWTFIDLTLGGNASWANVFPSDFTRILKGDSGAKLDVSFRASRRDVFSIWIRALFSKSAGKIGLCVDNEVKQETYLKTHGDDRYKWARLGSVEMSEGIHILSITSEMGKIYMDTRLVIVHESALEQTLTDVSSKLKSKTCLSVDEFVRCYDTRPLLACKFVEAETHRFDLVLPKEARVLVSTIGYDERWTISDGREERRSIIGQGMVNAFVVRDLSRNVKIFYKGEAEMSTLWVQFRFLLVLFPSLPLGLAILQKRKFEKPA